MRCAKRNDQQHHHAGVHHPHAGAKVEPPLRDARLAHADSRFEYTM